MAHAGSWFGLPDFGVTEKIGNTVGNIFAGTSLPRTQQGGSNLFGSNTNPVIQQGGVWQPAAQQYTPTTGNVLAYQTTDPANPTQPQPNRNPSIPTQNVVPSMEPQFNEIDSAFNSRMGLLNEMESKIRGDYPSFEQQALGQYNAGLSQLDASKNASTAQISEADTKSRKRKEDALGSARRLYNELKMGGQQRYGGSSSAGQAFSELNNVEQQRRSGDVFNSYEETQRTIMGQKQAVEDQYKASVMQLQAQKDTAVNQARRDFENKLLSISQMRNEANESKANMRLQALQDYRNEIFQVNLQTMQFQQQLQAQQQATSSELDNAFSQFNSMGGSAQNAYGAFNQNTTTSPETSLKVGGFGQGSQPMAMTGSIARKPEDMYTGSINPYVRRDQFSMA